VRQIGQAAWHSEPLQLASGSTIPLPIRLAPYSYTLPEITVTALRSGATSASLVTICYDAS
jgi:hypothetical protein